MIFIALILRREVSKIAKDFQLCQGLVTKFISDLSNTFGDLNRLMMEWFDTWESPTKVHTLRNTERVFHIRFLCTKVHTLRNTERVFHIRFFNFVSFNYDFFVHNKTSRKFRSVCGRLLVAWHNADIGSTSNVI